MTSVSVRFSHPERILLDYSKLLDSVDFEKVIDKNIQTLLKVNISWDRYYPGCSTSPWQLEGVIKKLKETGFKDILSAHTELLLLILKKAGGRINMI